MTQTTFSLDLNELNRRAWILKQNPSWGKERLNPNNELSDRSNCCGTVLYALSLEEMFKERLSTLDLNQCTFKPNKPGYVPPEIMEVIFFDAPSQDNGEEGDIGAVWSGPSRYSLYHTFVVLRRGKALHQRGVGGLFERLKKESIESDYLMADPDRYVEYFRVKDLSYFF